jgi:protein-tyrosine phosphatase
MLELAEVVEQPGIESLALPIKDGEPIAPATFAQGLAFVQQQQQAGRVVLVACAAGISRSTTFAIAALKEAEQLSLLEAATIVRQLHPRGLPHSTLWSSLCAYYQEPLSYLDLIRAGE